MSEYLELTFPDNEKEDIVNHLDFRTKPFSNSKVFLAPIESYKLLTKGQDVKRVYDLKLSVKDITFDFLPGDTIGILPCNNNKEVNDILIRLKIDSKSEKIYKLTILKDNKKKSLKLPKHVPSTDVLRNIFRYYIDLRKPPKKLFLKALIPFMTNAEEVQRIEEICLPTGSKQYSELISGGANTLLGLLNTFPSCYPPVELILEHSVPLQPRYFSVASSPLENGSLHITFFVVENQDGVKGVCTGWLEKLITTTDTVLEKIPFYFRAPSNFRIPSDLKTPFIMIATGTGIAPFKGFLDHRLLIRKTTNCDVGDAFLFYGCRYSDRDFLYSNDIQEYLNEEVLTKLYTTFSRENGKKCYIQDKINERGEEIIYNILNKQAVIFVCGNTIMVKDIKNAIINNLILYGNFDQARAEEYLMKLCKSNQFIVDSWT